MEHLNKSLREYAIYTIENRALPAATDGLKPSQRKALFAVMNKTDKIKTISLAGEMISKEIYLHGDAAAAETISKMAAPYTNNICWLQGIGSFGTRVSPTGWGQPRYTYVKLSNETKSMMLTDKNIVPMVDNYDGSTKEPWTFLPLIPTVFVNGASGMATGWSTEILRRNPIELIERTIEALDNKKLGKLEPYYEFYKSPSVKLENNKWQFKGVVKKIDNSNCIIEELPPWMTLDKLTKTLNQLIEQDKIVDYQNASTKTISIEVKFKRNQIADWDEEKLISFFKLTEIQTERIVVIIDNDWTSETLSDNLTKMVYNYDNPEQLIKDFVKWRLKWFKRRYEQLVKENTDDLLYWMSLKACFDKKIPKQLPVETKEKFEEMISTAIKASKLIIEEKNIQKISDMSSYKWNDNYYQEVLTKISFHEQELEKYKNILNNNDEIKKIYKNELVDLLKEIKKRG
jgi:DNA gyrase/topoisomerase IV subunit A